MLEKVDDGEQFFLKRSDLSHVSITLPYLTQKLASSSDGSNKTKDILTCPESKKISCKVQHCRWELVYALRTHSLAIPAPGGSNNIFSFSFTRSPTSYLNISLSVFFCPCFTVSFSTLEFIISSAFHCSESIMHLSANGVKRSRSECTFIWILFDWLFQFFRFHLHLPQPYGYNQPALFS